MVVDTISGPGVDGDRPRDACAPAAPSPAWAWTTSWARRRSSTGSTSSCATSRSPAAWCRASATCPSCSPWWRPARSTRRRCSRTRSPLDEAAEGYRLMAERAEGVTKVALRPRRMSVDASASRPPARGTWPTALERLAGDERGRGSRAEIEALDLDLSGGWWRACSASAARPCSGRDRARRTPSSLIPLPRDRRRPRPRARAPATPARRSCAEGGGRRRAAGRRPGHAPRLRRARRGSTRSPRSPGGPCSPTTRPRSRRCARATAPRCPGTSSPRPRTTTPPGRPSRPTDWFGLDPDSVRLVVQGTLPAVDREHRARSCSTRPTTSPSRPTATAACSRRCGPRARSTRWPRRASARSSRSRWTTRSCGSADPRCSATTSWPAPTWRRSWSARSAPRRRWA